MIVWRLPFVFNKLRHRRAKTSYEMDRACYCSHGVVIHQPNCRASRPQCRWMRQVREERRVCTCSMYPFPHRFGSGRCRIGIPYGLELDDDTEMIQRSAEAVPF
jgi:hypothetical protein